MNTKANKKNGYKILMIVGIALLICAAVLVSFSVISRSQGEKKNQEALTFIQSVLPARSVGLIENTKDTVMPTISFNDVDYIGILDVVDFESSLPVAAKWDKIRSAYVPSIFSGSVYDGTLIIGGSDQKGQLEWIKDIDLGNAVTFTDMTGKAFRFTVTSVLHNNALTADSLKDDTAQLTIFARSSGNNDGIVVRCSTVK